MSTPEQTQDLSFRAFLWALGRGIWGLRKVKLEPFESGCVKSSTLIVLGFFALLYLPIPLNILGVLIIIFGFLLFGHGLWVDDKKRRGF